MSFAPSAALFQLPSVKQFLTRLADDLASRRSVLAPLPEGINPRELLDALREELWGRSFEVGVVSLAGLSEERTLVNSLSEDLGITWNPIDTPRSIRNLMATGKLPDVILLEDLEQLPPQKCRDWIDFLSNWAQVCHGRPENISTSALCLVGPAPVILSQRLDPEDNVYLAVHWWWGFPSALETRLICRLNSDHEDRDPVDRWREHVMPAIVGNDVNFVSDMWNELHQMESCDLPSFLCNMAEQRGWKADSLQEWTEGKDKIETSNNTHNKALSPPLKLRALWAKGIVGWTMEYGLEFHTVALAVLKRHEDLQHRLWRGQTGLILPLADRIRQEFCRHLTRTYGRDWPVRWCPPENEYEERDVRQNPLTCQWGHLEKILSCFLVSEEYERIHLARLTRKVRNEIAHYRPVSFRDFKSIWREIDQVSDSAISTLRNLAV